MSEEKNRAIKRALKQVKRGNIDTAIQLYSKARSYDPNDPRILLRLASLHNQRKRRKEAADLYKEAAEKLINRGFFERAASVLGQALLIDDTDEKTYLKAAELYMRLNEPQRALPYYNKLSTLYRRKGKTWEAIEVLEKIRVITPGNLELLKKLSDLYFEYNMPDQGLSALRPVIKNARDREDYENLLILLERVDSVFPQDLGNLNELADFYDKRGFPALAIKSLQRIREITPDDTAVLRRIADLSSKNGWEEQAMEALTILKEIYDKRGYRKLSRSAKEELEELAAKDSTFVLVREGGFSLQEDRETEDPAQEQKDYKALVKEEISEIGELYRNLKDPEKALQHYRQLVVEYEEQGRIEDAIEVVEQMCKLAPENMVMAAKLSDLLFESGSLHEGYLAIKPVINSIKASGDRDSHLRLLERVEKKDPENTENLLEMAGVLESEGETARAYNALVKLHRLKPEDEKLLRRMADIALAEEWKERAMSALNILKERYEKDGQREKNAAVMKEILALMLEVDLSQMDASHEMVEIDIEATITEKVGHPEEEAPRMKAPARALISDLDPDEELDDQFVDLTEIKKEASLSEVVAWVYPSADFDPKEWKKTPDTPEEKEERSWRGRDLFEKELELFEASWDDEDDDDEEILQLELGSEAMVSGKIFGPSILKHAVVFCPFPAVAEIAADTPGAEKEEGTLGGAPVHTLSFEGRQISLVGPVKRKDNVTSVLKTMARKVSSPLFILDLCGFENGPSESPCLSVRFQGDKGDGKAEAAIMKALVERNIRYAPYTIGDPGKLTSAGLDLEKIMEINCLGKFDLGCLMVVARDRSVLGDGIGLSESPVIMDLWRACYAVIDAAFELSSSDNHD